jgi:hypothetical protein
MPKGTEKQLEPITENAIIEKMKRGEKTRKSPIDRWAQGDPPWVPQDRLTVVQKAHSDSEMEIMEALK